MRKLNNLKIEKYIKPLTGFACAIPPILLLVFIYQYYFNAPYSDQWGLIRFIEKSFHGELTFFDFWVQKNVHRIFFPKLIMLPLARVTNWNTGYEVAIIFLIGCGVYAIIIGTVFKTFRQKGFSLPWFLPVFLSLMIFSISQYHNWLFGMQIQLFLNVLAAVAGFCILCCPLSYMRILIAGIFGFIATHSFANGLAYWVVGLFVVTLSKAEFSMKLKLAFIWLMFSIFAIWSFFHGYTVHGNGVVCMLQNPLNYLLYVLAYLGSPVAGFYVKGAIVAGAFGLFLFAGIVICLHINKISLRLQVPYICLGLYAIGSSLITAVGRCELGFNQAAESRYITISNLLWVADIILIVFTFRKYRQSAGDNLTGRIRKHVAGAFLICLLPCILYGYLKGAEAGKKMGDSVRSAGQIVQKTYPVVDIEVMKKLNRAKPLFAKKLLPTLKKYNLSMFVEK